MDDLSPEEVRRRAEILVDGGWAAVVGQEGAVFHQTSLRSGGHISVAVWRVMLQLLDEQND